MGYFVVVVVHLFFCLFVFVFESDPQIDINIDVILVGP